MSSESSPKGSQLHGSLYKIAYSSLWFISILFLRITLSIGIVFREALSSSLVIFLEPFHVCRRILPRETNHEWNDHLQ